MSNSKLISYTKLSPNHSGKRTMAIDRITPHCVVGQCSVETIGEIFLPVSRQASSNYGIGPDGRIGMYVEEKNRSWCSSSNANDQRAVTIECASDSFHPFAFNDVVYNKLIELCIDICNRNGKSRLVWFGDKDKTLNYTPKSNEMILTVHRWFSATACPGDWLYARMGTLAKTVTKALSAKTSTDDSLGKDLYRIQVGAYKKKTNAEKCLQKLKNAGFDAFIAESSDYYRVQAGAYRVKTNADTALKKIKDAGFDAFIVTIKDYYK